MEIDFIDFLVEFCLNEISLEGLQGCTLNNLFDLLSKSSKRQVQFELDQNELSSNKYLKLNQLFTSCESNSELRNFIWKLVINQFDVNLYLEQNSSEKASTKSKNSFNRSLVQSKTTKTELDFVINDSNLNQRGFCTNYYTRSKLNINSSLTYEECLQIYDSNKIILVTSQQLRNKVLCPSFKYLEFENLNQLEYCVLEAIAKSRYDGICSTGDKGLTQLFNLQPKQLHYILVNLESHELIKKQILTSEKKRSIIHLSKFAFRKKLF